MKWIVPVKRRLGVSRDELFDKWEHLHAPHVRDFAKPEQYRVTFFEAPPADSDPPFDGMTELWFRDWQHWARTFGDDAPAERDADGFGQFIAPREFQLFTTEQVIVAGDVSRAHLKQVAFIRRRREVPLQQLLHAWRETHAPNVAAGIARTPGCLRYAISQADRGREGRMDGIAELWWADADALSAGLQGVEPDGFGDLLLADATIRLTGHEFVVVP